VTETKRNLTSYLESIPDVLKSRIAQP